MKYLAFILSIYIFALNLAPCTDYDVPDNDVKTEISQAFSDDHQHQGSDLCPPFCQCCCCHIHATHFKIVEFTINSTEIPTDIFHYFNGLEKDFNNSILQPPRA